MATCGTNLQAHFQSFGERTGERLYLRGADQRAGRAAVDVVLFATQSERRVLGSADVQGRSDISNRTIALPHRANVASVWLGRCPPPRFTTIFVTLPLPNTEELVPCTSRHGGKEKAEAFVLNDMTDAMRNPAHRANAACQLNIY